MAKRDLPPGLRAPATVFLAVFVLACLSGPARAAGSVSVDIGVVVASNEGTSVDSSLSSMRPKLQAMFNYSSYKLVDRMKRTLAVGETGEFELPGRRTIRVTPSPAAANKVRLSVQIMEGGRSLLSTTLGLARGGMVLVGGPPHQSGVLILLISAE